MSWWYRSTLTHRDGAKHHKSVHMNSPYKLYRSTPAVATQSTIIVNVMTHHLRTKTHLFGYPIQKGPHSVTNGCTAGEPISLVSSKCEEHLSAKVNTLAANQQPRLQLLRLMLIQANTFFFLFVFDEKDTRIGHQTRPLFRYLPKSNRYMCSSWPRRTMQPLGISREVASGT